MSDQTEALFEAYCADALGVAEEARLVALLEADPSMRAAFGQHLLLHSGLSEAMGQLVEHDRRTQPRRRVGLRPRRPARRRHGRRPGALVAAALLAVAVIAVAALAARQSTVADPGDASGRVVVRAVDGTATVQVEGRRLALATGSDLPLGATVESRGELVLAYRGEATALRFSGICRATLLQRRDGGKTIDLESGSLHLEVAPQSAAPLVVRSAQALATVVGTRFRVDAGTGWTRVAVDAGAVRVEARQDDRRVLLQAGEDVTIGARSDEGWVFHLGIDLGGTGAVIDGERWLSHQAALAAGLVLEGQLMTDRTAVEPRPPVDPALREVLDTTLWSSRAPLRLALPLPPGRYRVSLLVMENHSSGKREFDLRLEGRQVATALGRLELGQWRRYGPFEAALEDGRLDLLMTSPDDSPHLMGLLVERFQADRGPP